MRCLQPFIVTRVVCCCYNACVVFAFIIACVVCFHFCVRCLRLLLRGLFAFSVVLFAFVVTSVVCFCCYVRCSLFHHGLRCFVPLPRASCCLVVPCCFLFRCCIRFLLLVLRVSACFRCCVRCLHLLLLRLFDFSVLRCLHLLLRGMFVTLRALFVFVATRGALFHCCLSLFVPLPRSLVCSIVPCVVFVVVVACVVCVWRCLLVLLRAFFLFQCCVHVVCFCCCVRVVRLCCCVVCFHCCVRCLRVALSAFIVTLCVVLFQCYVCCLFLLLLRALLEFCVASAASVVACVVLFCCCYVRCFVPLLRALRCFVVACFV